MRSAPHSAPGSTWKRTFNPTVPKVHFGALLRARPEAFNDVWIPDPQESAGSNSGVSDASFGFDYGFAIDGGASPERTARRREGLGDASRRQNDQCRRRTTAYPHQKPFGWRPDGLYQRAAVDRRSGRHRALIVDHTRSCGVDQGRPRRPQVRPEMDLGELRPAQAAPWVPCAASAPRNPVSGVGQGRKGLLQCRRARHFARRDEGRADRGILRRKKVVVVVESLRPIKGEMRWYSVRKARASCSTTRWSFEESPNGSASALSSPASRRLTKRTDATYFSCS